MAKKKPAKKKSAPKKQVEEQPHIPTPEEIQKEIAALKEIKPLIRRTSMFGDNHHDAIDAQVAVLEEDMDEDKIYDEYGDLDGEQPENVRSAAIAARQWLDGEKDYLDDSKGLADSWESLRIIKKEK